MCNQQRLRPACSYVQSDQSLCSLLEYSMSLKLLTKHDLEFLSLKGGCTGSPQSTLVKMTHCWKSHAVAQFAIMHIYLEACISNDTIKDKQPALFLSKMIAKLERIKKNYHKTSTNAKKTMGASTHYDTTSTESITTLES